MEKLSPIVICDPYKIDNINNIIHDCFFDVNNIKFDEENSILSIEFEIEKVDQKKVIGKRFFLK